MPPQGCAVQIAIPEIRTYQPPPRDHLLEGKIPNRHIITTKISAESVSPVALALASAE